MNMETIRTFFGWCTVINGSLFLLSFILSSLAGDWVYRLHGKLFPMSRATFSLTMYCFVVGMKALIVIFNLAPYLALVIMSR